MLKEQLSSFNLVLGSQSPRRQYLLKELGVEFETRVISTDEEFDPSMAEPDIAEFLAHQKALAHQPKGNELIITADTIVCFDGDILNKPADKAESIEMLTRLSGNTHEVITGVCLYHKDATRIFHERTSVTFHPLSQEEIEHYIDTCQPFDKAGSYGIQEWMGYAGIKSIEGDFFNVMGLPLQLLYRELITFSQELEA